jgi:hypothetical protein
MIVDDGSSPIRAWMMLDAPSGICFRNPALLAFKKNVFLRGTQREHLLSKVNPRIAR